MIILGIDPGSQITGFGLIELRGSRPVYLDSGCVRTAGEMHERLREIYAGLAAIIEARGPQEAAVERVFVHRNVDSALKLGQARGAALCAVVNASLPVSEYSATQIKQAVVGRGRAAKTQVQHMVRALLGLTRQPQADAADALAVALCHCHMRQTLSRIAGVRAVRAGRLR